jgi:hypothetical protein
MPHTDCQPKRQQKCWKSAGSGSGGVVLDSIVRFGIFSPENALEATDSDSRPQRTLRAEALAKAGSTKLILKIGK